MKQLLMIVLVLSSKAFAQNNCTNKLVASHHTALLCGSSLIIDSLNNIYYSTGCEQHVSYAFDKCHISNDTIYIDRSNLLLKQPFFVTETKNTGNTQTIAFKTLNGNTINYRYDHKDSAYFAIARTKKDKRKDLMLKNSLLSFKNGSIKVLEFPLLERIFGVPITFWVKKGYSYELRINVPFPLDLCIHSASNFSEQYLLIDGNDVVFPKNNFRMKLVCRK